MKRPSRRPRSEPVQPQQRPIQPVAPAALADVRGGENCPVTDDATL